MAKIVDFVVIFDDGVRKRHNHETEKGKVAYFAVQLEIRVKDEWRVVLRYDCSHGFPHMDKYDIKGKQTKRLLNLSFESALTFGDWDINENWLKYKQEFLKKGGGTMSNYTNFLAMVSTEFHRYLMENDEFSDNIPANALVIFQVEGEDDFNNWQKEMSLRNREPDQPIIYVYVKKWRKHSSIEEIRLAKVA